jgi:hypothetical protein
VANGDMKVEKDVGGMQKMTFTPPQMSEEDNHAIHMPDYLKCDGCMAVSFSLHRAFENEHKKHVNFEWRLSEAELLEKFGKILVK